MGSKITIIGAGSVGATIAYNLSQDDVASLTKVFFNGKIPVVELVTYCPSDAGRIMNYMMNS